MRLHITQRPSRWQNGGAREYRQIFHKRGRLRGIEDDEIIYAGDDGIGRRETLGESETLVVFVLLYRVFYPWLPRDEDAMTGGLQIHLPPGRGYKKRPAFCADEQGNRVPGTIGVALPAGRHVLPSTPSIDFDRVGSPIGPRVRFVLP